jgi:nitrite reductase/ring-hydroxylating ferredoxin subunit
MPTGAPIIADPMILIVPRRNVDASTTGLTGSRPDRAGTLRRVRRGPADPRRTKLLTRSRHPVTLRGGRNSEPTKQPMDLPASVAALGEQLGGSGEIAPEPALFQATDVFAAERERIFLRPWVAVDHASRLDRDSHYFRFDAATRSMLVTRDSGGRLHALRNVCIHAGYPVCDAQEDAAERLVCLYHGWEYALDGRLVEPAFASRIDRSRLRLPSYRVCIHKGLIFVDLSGRSSDEEIAGPLPAWLARARVTIRAQYGTAWNWKFVLQFLRSRSDLYFDDLREADDDEHRVEFGPLDWMLVRPQQAALLRVIPRFAERTDFQLIRMVAREAPETNGSTNGADPVAEALCSSGEAAAANWSSRLDRRFFSWYWPLMAQS